MIRKNAVDVIERMYYNTVVADDANYRGEEAITMVRVNRLKAQMLERECSMEQLSEEIGLHISTLYRKMREPDSIRVWELVRIRDALGLTGEQVLDIFFAE